MEAPVLWLISGPNGSGKTTLSKTFIPTEISGGLFVNADEIAKGISPFNSRGIDVLAARVALNCIEEYIAKGLSFALETTLSGNIHKKIVERVKGLGWTVGIIYVYLQSPEIAQDRVTNRVKFGGHFIEKSVIIRRYYRGLNNLKWYCDQADRVLILNNSEKRVTIVAELDRIKNQSAEFSVIDQIVFKKLLGM